MSRAMTAWVLEVPNGEKRGRYVWVQPLDLVEFRPYRSKHPTRTVFLSPSQNTLEGARRAAVRDLLKWLSADDTSPTLPRPLPPRRPRRVSTRTARA